MDRALDCGTKCYKFMSHFLPFSSGVHLHPANCDSNPVTKTKGDSIVVSTSKRLKSFFLIFNMLVTFAFDLGIRNGSSSTHGTDELKMSAGDTYAGVTYPVHTKRAS